MEIQANAKRARDIVNSVRALPQDSTLTLGCEHCGNEHHVRDVDPVPSKCRSCGAPLKRRMAGYVVDPSMVAT